MNISSICAGGLNYDGDNALLNDPSNVMYDSDLNTYKHLFSSEKKWFPFGVTYTFNSYFIKQEGCNVFRFRDTYNPIAIDIKEQYEKDGGIYYVLNSPVTANGFYVETGSSSYNKIYELELFSVASVGACVFSSKSEIYSISIDFFCKDATEYDIYIDEVLQTTTTDNNYVFQNLSPNHNYNIKVVGKAKGLLPTTYQEIIKTDVLPLKLKYCNRSDKVNFKDTVTFTFNKELSTFIKYVVTDFDSYTIDGNILTIKIKNDYETNVNMDFTVTDIDGETLTINQKFITIKKGGIFMTFDFSFISDWTDALLPTLKTSSIAVITSVLGLAGIIIGGFFLIGLVKKAVGKAK